ncbi:MAG: S53 family peptidase [Aquabacterium sp.]|nr:S53 family peptidase [Aquabacterium sp.]
MPRHLLTALTLSAAVALAACGGGDPASPAAATPLDTTAQALALDVAEAIPAFHSVGQIDPPALLQQAPQRHTVQLRAGTRLNLGDGAHQAGVSTGDDTPDQSIQASRPTTAVVHTPASIRSLYGMPALPAKLAGLTAAQRADLGAGQTIDIVGAFAGANLLQDLNTFSTRFGPPTCRQVAVPVQNPVRPLPAAPMGGCTLAIVNSAAGSLRAAAPAYNAGWAPEFALDVQWAHATAPLARIVVVQAENALTTSLSGAITLVNRLGPGVVNMSFGAPEGNYVEPYEALFATAGMSYVAAAGDSGAQANWPAVGTGVLSVGGTTAWMAGNLRNEVVWSRSGGGFSSWLPRPAYQAGLSVAGAGLTRTPASQPNRPARAVTDVSFNADPFTGQMTVVTAPGGTARWFSMGGTSVGAPQWAGILAVANAHRALAGAAPLGRIHAGLYRTLAAGRVFNDVTEGSNGSPVWARAGARYDIPTGWGTPKVATFLQAATALR